MSTNALSRLSERTPSLFDDFFKPWSEWFGNGDYLWGKTLNVPAVNITEEKDGYMVSLAAPGMEKDDFKIDMEGNMLIISCKKEESKEEKEEKYTRKEYNYSSFSRSFTLPDEVNKEKIDAKYDKGILKISLPCNEGFRKTSTKHIDVK